MANTAQGGFRFRRQRNGSVIPLTELRTVATGQTSAIFNGDPVAVQADGSVVQCTLTGNIYGVCDGIEQYWDGQAIRRGSYLPAATAWGTVRERRSIARVILARDAIFEVDSNATLTTATEAGAEAMISNIFLMASGAGGSTTNGQSSFVLDVPVGGTGNVTGTWKVVGLSTRPDNDYTTTAFKVLVEANLSDEPQYTTAAV